MTTTEIPSQTSNGHVKEHAPVERTEPTPTEVPVSLAASPALLGYPAFAIGALSLALFLTGFNQVTIPSTLAGSLPIMIVASGFLLIVASVWAIKRNEGVHAAMFGLFGAFWLSFTVLIIGLLDNWFGKLPEPAQRGANANFLLIWFVLMLVFTGATLRLPKAVTLLFVLIDFSLITLFAAVSIARPGAGGDPFILHPGIAALFTMPFVALYLFASSVNTALGGKSFPMGKPFIRKR
ncbi:hypothetical protein Lesp02_84720 [Lentzea sp. NBRC 105346]|uniref:GPR1/FUN34/YaaH family transporter n=1 Tax=Lentzea sp. NBRC 105346 TaxID=3032205 RepID=UPI0024A4D910|nr:GPR1/FUN34/YaaH family transporter [Lentzea sp. NBRC 105346]GLZ36285.1 hypothetical protein Lesp02_84720 [Lentzea sp. NBRC 105346]